MMRGLPTAPGVPTSALAAQLLDPFDSGGGGTATCTAIENITPTARRS
jgi:hypothetical protein